MKQSIVCLSSATQRVKIWKFLLRRFPCTLMKRGIRPVFLGCKLKPTLPLSRELILKAAAFHLGLFNSETVPWSPWWFPKDQQCRWVSSPLSSRDGGFHLPSAIRDTRDDQRIASSSRSQFFKGIVGSQRTCSLKKKIIAIFFSVYLECLSELYIFWHGT